MLGRADRPGQRDAGSATAQLDALTKALDQYRNLVPLRDATGPQGFTATRTGPDGEVGTAGVLPVPELSLLKNTAELCCKSLMPLQKGWADTFHLPLRDATV